MEAPTSLDVTSGFGFILTLEYVNTLRSISGVEPMLQDEYEKLCEEAMSQGRDAIIGKHREAVDKAFFSNRA